MPVSRASGIEPSSSGSGRPARWRPPPARACRGSAPGCSAAPGAEAGRPARPWRACRWRRACRPARPRRRAAAGGRARRWACRRSPSGLRSWRAHAGSSRSSLRRVPGRGTGWRRPGPCPGRSLQVAPWGRADRRAPRTARRPVPRPASAVPGPLLRSPLLRPANAPMTNPTLTLRMRCSLHLWSSPAPGTYRVVAIGSADLCGVRDGRAAACRRHAPTSIGGVGGLP